MKTRRDFVHDASKGVLAASVAPVLALGDVLAATQTGTGLVSDPRYLEHRLPDRGGEPHPERPLRLVRIAEAFRASGVDRELTPLPLLADPLPFIRAHHARDHVESVRQIAVTGRVSELAVAGALGAVDAVVRGQVRNAFCAIRPPGAPRQQHRPRGGLLLLQHRGDRGQIRAA